MSIMELLVIFVVTIIVFGPSKLPELSLQLAKVYRLIQHAKKQAQDFMAKQQAQLQLEENIKKATQAEKPQTKP